MNSQDTILTIDTTPEPPHALIYVPVPAGIKADAETQKRVKLQIARCRRRAKASGALVTAVSHDLSAAFKALEAGEVQALVVINAQDLVHRPQDVFRVTSRLQKAGARLITCDLTEEEAAAKAEALARKKSKDGILHSRIRSVPIPGYVKPTPGTIQIVSTSNRPAPVSTRSDNAVEERGDIST